MTPRYHLHLGHSILVTLSQLARTSSIEPAIWPKQSRAVSKFGDGVQPWSLLAKGAGVEHQRECSGVRRVRLTYARLELLLRSDHAAHQGWTRQRLVLPARDALAECSSARPVSGDDKSPRTASGARSFGFRVVGGPAPATPSNLGVDRRDNGHLQGALGGLLVCSDPHGYPWSSQRTPVSFFFLKKSSALQRRR